MPTPYNLEIRDRCTECEIRNHGTFCKLSSEGSAALEEMRYSTVYPKGSVLFVEGDVPRGVYIVCRGEAKLSTTSSDGKTLIVRIAEAGEVLGASATILGRPYELTAETLEPSQVSFVRRDDFLRFVETRPEASLNTARVLSEKYQSAQREIRSLGLSRTTAERLARLILDWCDASGTETPRGTRIRVLLTHEDIAQRIGTTRETVTRLLSDFRRRGVVEVKGSSFTVLDRGVLEDLVGAGLTHAAV
ncbi:MAG TPA: Crp/Fnr family transcriptional regulator [Thermoanaerobaculia bacterium]|nr:Crp/Fnr family transcriptional regulator [Thermoanaerobaculia bacterium]